MRVIVGKSYVFKENKLGVNVGNHAIKDPYLANYHAHHPFYKNEWETKKSVLNGSHLG